MKKTISLESFQALLFCLLPAALITGPFLSDLFLSSISIIFIYLTIITRDWKYYKNKLFIFYLFWCFYLIIISVLSDNPRLSLESSLFFFRFGVFALATWYILEKNEKVIFYFLISILVSFTVLIFDGYYQLFYDVNLFGNQTTHNSRISSLFGDEFIMGNYLARMLPIMFSLIIYNFGKNHLLMYASLLLFILTDVLIYVSGERTAFLLLLLSSFAIIVSIERYKLLRIISMLLSILIIAGITFHNEDIRNRMIGHTFDQMAIDKYDNERGFSRLHVSLMIVSIRLFSSEPLFGIGPKLFRDQCNDPEIRIGDGTGCSTHPHNIYFQSLAETGIVGSIPIIIAFIYILSLFARQIYSGFFKKKYLLEDYEVCLYGALLTSFWPLIPSFSLFNNWVNVIVFLPIGFILYFSNNKKKL